MKSLLKSSKTIPSRAKKAMYDAHWHCTDTYNKKMMLPECQALLNVTLYFLTIYFYLLKNQMR